MFYLTSLRGKEYFAKEPEPEPGVFGKKIRSRSRIRLKKKSGARAAKKFAGSPALIGTVFPFFISPAALEPPNLKENI